MDKTLERIEMNSISDDSKEEERHFTDGYGFYKIFWLFLIGSVLGVVIEVIWCFITSGHYESRVGLVYGPLNLLYGFGTVFMSLGLCWLREKSNWFIFLGGFIIGSVYEYFCSWLQEYLFGSVSWQYDFMPLNLDGRINVVFSCFWGILALLWVKILEPFMCKMLRKIPNKIGKTLTWIILVFIIIDAAISFAAVWRWGDRLLDIPPSNSIDVYLDNHFPNERLEKIFPNMDFISL